MAKMGKAGFIVALILGIIITLIGLLFLGYSLSTTAAFSSWFALFAALFIFIIAAICFYAASRAKPRQSLRKY
jgi:uncharacterized membrane protein YdjX (TVP38/TMEM64 family)